MYLTLYHHEDERIFIRLANQDRVLPFATIEEERNPYSYTLRRVVVKGYSFNPRWNADGHAHVSLGVTDWIPKRVSTSFSGKS